MANPSTRTARSAPHKKTRFASATAPAPAAASAGKALLPLGALMLAASFSGWAQTNTSPANAPAATASPTDTLTPVTVREKADDSGKDSLRVNRSGIGKGDQELRDIPQSVTVVTEKLMDDRNLDTVKEALKNTAGISFLAAEGGEEDIRLRGFPLQSTGDLFIDGIRDPAFYERDTFNLDRLEILRGSASMLFGRGSTGGAVNQVSKLPRLITEHEVTTTLGNHSYKRLTGDFNIKTGDDAALRINAMSTSADNNGAGSSLDKKGLAVSYRLGIGTANEFLASLYHLDNNNGMNYGMPWIRPNAASPASDTTVLPLDPKAYYGMASDYNAGSATMATLGHIHRFSSDSELKTQLRVGKFDRDQRAGTVRLSGPVTLANFGPNTVLTRGTQLKIQDMETVHLQSDFSNKFAALGVKHELLTGFDFASEKKTVYAARAAAQGGVNLTKPNTLVRTPDDGASVDEGSRVLRPSSDFSSTGMGVYAQDLIQVAPHWKVLLGLRYDRMQGDYNTYAIPAAAPGPVTNTPYSQKISAWSKRAGLLFQPNPLHSYHLSYGTSFNTSGDTYSYSPATVNTPPESSRNIELGAKLDTEDKRFTTRLALFHSTKLHERNTDPLIPIDVLSGKRHAAGFEIDVTGRLTPAWEVYGSFMWMPSARIDIGAAGAEGQGSRPSLTPVHSGTVWTTYQLTSKFRVGGGLTFRGEQTPIRNPGWKVPGFVTGDLMAEYVVNEMLAVKANLTNVTNKLYADSLYSGHYIPGAGRLLQVSASVKF